MGERDQPLFKAYAQLENTVAENQRAKHAPADVLRLENEDARLVIRPRGAIVVGCALGSPYGGPALKLLYADGDLRRPNLEASFAMSPVVNGKRKHGGLGGIFQWLDFDQEVADPESNGTRHLQLVANLGKTGLPIMKRAFELSPYSLKTTTRLYNQREKKERTGLGELYNLRYKSKDTKDLKKLRMNGHLLKYLLGHDAQDQLMEGKPVIWSGFDEHAEITLPSSRVFSIGVQTNHEYRNRLGLIIWRRSERAIAVQPTLGINRSGGKWGIDIPPHDHATPITTLEAREAA